MKHLLRNLAYSFPAFAFAVPTLPVMILLPPLYSEKFGYDIYIIGLSIFFARIIDIISDPIIGWICDKNSPKAMGTSTNTFKNRSTHTNEDPVYHL